jgi:hypothetical protein
MCQRVGLRWPARIGTLFARLVSPRRHFAIPLNDPELFTGNPIFQRFIRDDPLALRTGTARLLVESARMDVYNR